MSEQPAAGSAATFDVTFTKRYALIARAMIDGDDVALRRLAVEMGYLRPENSEEYVEKILDIIRLVSEPAIKGGVYDSGKSDVFARGRDTGIDRTVFAPG